MYCPRIPSGNIRCPKHQATSICEPSNQQEEIKHLRNTFCKNGYPDEVLDPIFKNKKQKPSSKNKNIGDKDEDGMGEARMKSSTDSVYRCFREDRKALQSHTILQAQISLQAYWYHQKLVSRTGYPRKGRKEWYMKFLTKIVTRST